MDLKRVALAHREQLRLCQKFQELFDEIDLLICPGVTVLPFPFDQLYSTEIDGRPMTNYVHWAALTSASRWWGIRWWRCPAAWIPRARPSASRSWVRSTTIGSRSAPPTRSSSSSGPTRASPVPFPALRRSRAPACVPAGLRVYRDVPARLARGPSTNRGSDAERSR